MKKVSIIMYSTFSGDSYKAPYLKKVVESLHANNMLGSCFGMWSNTDKISFDRKLNNKLHLSIISRTLARILTKLSRLFPIPDYYGYLSGEIINGFFSKRMVKNSSEIVYLKPRPLFVVKKFKELNRIVIIEASESHPRYTQEKLLNEHRMFDIKSDSIFVNGYAVSQFEKSLNYADYIVALSRASADTYIAKGISQDKIKVINLNNPMKSLTRKKHNDGEIVFVCTAFHSILKGTHRLLMAWKKTGIKNSKLYIIGSLHEDLKEFIRKNGPFENVIFTGTMNKKQLVDFYSLNNCVGILLSLSEAFPRVVIEYMSCSIPVIVTSVATCDLVEDGKNGFIVSYDDELSIISRINKFIQMDREDYFNMCDSAYYSAQTLNDNFAYKLIEIFKEL